VTGGRGSLTALREVRLREGVQAVARHPHRSDDLPIKPSSWVPFRLT
jgi:hypothetical protein